MNFFLICAQSLLHQEIKPASAYREYIFLYFRVLFVCRIIRAYGSTSLTVTPCNFIRNEFTPALVNMRNANQDSLTSIIIFITLLLAS
jgi:hypothetical protein